MNELQSEMAAVHAKESELLDYIEKMTAKCTQLQSTLSVIQAQVCTKIFQYMFRRSNLRCRNKMSGIINKNIEIFRETFFRFQNFKKYRAILERSFEQRKRGIKDEM